MIYDDVQDSHFPSPSLPFLHEEFSSSGRACVLMAFLPSVSCSAGNQAEREENFLTFPPISFAVLSHSWDILDFKCLGLINE